MGRFIFVIIQSIVLFAVLSAKYPNTIDDYKQAALMSEHQVQEKCIAKATKDNKTDSTEYNKCLTEMSKNAKFGIKISATPKDVLDSTKKEYASYAFNLSIASFFLMYLFDFLSYITTSKAEAAARLRNETPFGKVMSPILEAAILWFILIIMASSKIENLWT